eukprot:scaffold3673_cov393-Prasinococcus_capsulatus_cf.AAC.5
METRRSSPWPPRIQRPCRSLSRRSRPTLARAVARAATPGSEAQAIVIAIGVTADCEHQHTSATVAH